MFCFDYSLKILTLTVNNIRSYRALPRGVGGKNACVPRKILPRSRSGARRPFLVMGSPAEHLPVERQGTQRILTLLEGRLKIGICREIHLPDVLDPVDDVVEISGELVFGECVHGILHRYD